MESIPKDNVRNEPDFINEASDSVEGEMSDLVSSKNLTPEKVMNDLRKFSEFSDSKLDCATFINIKY